MTTSDYALIISVVSIFLSVGAFVWNVWQKFIFVKPALQVSFGVYTVLQPGAPSGDRQRLLSMTVTDMGPGAVILHACVARKKNPWWKRAKFYGMLHPIHGDPTDPNPRSLGPFSSGLPAKISEGEVKSFYFPYARDGFLKEGLSQVGINDTYQRNTWCRRKDMRKVNASYQRDFVPETSS
jgi:hypothetical protein